MSQHSGLKSVEVVWLQKKVDLNFPVAERRQTNLPNFLEVFFP